MWKINLNGIDIYNDKNPDKKYKLLDPVLTVEENRAGSLTFTVPVTNVIYNTIDGLEKEVIKVFKEGSSIVYWGGRVVTVVTDFWNNKRVTCEGDLAFLNDCCQYDDGYTWLTLPPNTETNENQWVAYQFLNLALQGYNTYSYYDYSTDPATLHTQRKAPLKYAITTNRNAVTAEIADGIVEGYDGRNYIPASRDSSKTNYQNVMSLVNKYGGIVIVRWTSSGNRILCWYADYPTTCNQVINFGKNLLDYVKTVDSQEIFTVVHPYGGSPPKYWSYSHTSMDISFSYGWYLYNGRWVQTTNQKQFAQSTDTIKIQPNCTYYYSGKIMGTHEYCAVLDKNKVPLKVFAGEDVYGNFVTFSSTKLDLPDEAVYLRFCWEYEEGDDITDKWKFGVYYDINVIEEAADWRSVTEISDANGGNAYLVVNQNLLNKYGWIEKRLDYPDINVAEGLKAVAQRYINSLRFDSYTIEVTAFDLHMLNVNTDDFNLLDRVRIVSKPHNTDEWLPITKMVIPFENPERQTFTFGRAIQKRISEIVGR